MFPEYNTQLQSAESCISHLFHSKTSTFRLETVSKSCNNTMPFHQPVSDHEMLCFSQTLKSTEQATKRRRGQWPPGDDSPDVAWFSIGVLSIQKGRPKLLLKLPNLQAGTQQEATEGFFSLPLNVKTRDGQEIDHLKS